MRKIEKQMIAAIDENKTFGSDNTLVKNVGQNHASVYLHHQHIADVINGTVLVNVATLRNYPTNTTKSRLRALGAHLVSKKGQLFLDDVLI